MSSLKKKQKKTPAKEKITRAFTVENVFDENSFDFHLSGGPLHTELLIASAIYKIGDKLGEPVPIKCKWFNIKEDGQLLEIENVSGAFYQPCVEDVGSKIYVQATPISSLEEYCGMPVFAEVGPLMMNKEIETTVMTMLEKCECLMISKMDSMTFPLIKEAKNYQTSLPLECQIKIDQDLLTLSISTEGDRKNFNEEIFKFPLGLSFPFIKICRMTNNVYEIYFEKDQMIRMMSENNVTRDIIAVTLKMLCGQKILDHKFLDNEKKSPVIFQEEVKIESEILENNKNDEEIKISKKIDENLKEDNNLELRKNDLESSKMPQMTEMNDILNINNNILGKRSPDKLIEEQKIQKNDEKSLETHIEYINMKPSNRSSMDLQLKLDQQDKDIAQLIHENEHLKREKHQFIDEITLHKKEKDQLSTELFNAKRNYMEALRENEQYKTKLEKFINEKNFLVQDLNLYKTQIKENEEIIASLELKIKNLTTQHEENLAEQGKMFDSQLKITENERIAEFEKEVSSLKQEIRIFNDQLQMKLGTIHELSQSNEDLENKVNYLMKKNESLQYETSKNHQSFERTINEEQDIEKLQMQIVAFEKTIKELKKDLEEEKMKKNVESAGKFEVSSLASIISNIVLVKSSNQQLQYMQKLANNLTEVISDRELALENQKNINKELIKRINELTEGPKKDKEN